MSIIIALDMFQYLMTLCTIKGNLQTETTKNVV